MKRMLMGLCLGTIIISGGMMGSGIDADLQALLKENNLSYVCETNIAKGKADVESSIRFFNAMRYACGIAIAGVIGSGLYNWCKGIQSRSIPEQITDIQKQLGELRKKGGMTSEAEQKNWFGSISLWGKGVVTGLPTYLASMIVSNAALGLMSAKLPMSEFAKSEPSFGWFLTHKTGFAAECGVLMIYYQQQAVHDAFCVETARLVGDVEKILGYIDYQIAQIKKSSSMAAKVLASRRAQLISMTNKLVDLVAQKQYEEMLGAVQLLNGFVHEGLTAGILQ